MSWKELTAIYEAAEEDRKTDIETEDAVCPICSELLQSNEWGDRICIYGHYRDDGSVIVY